MYAKPRLPDPVRAAAVRAVIIVALTLVLTMAAVLCSLAQVWLAFPLVLTTVAATVVATWAVLDVWVTRQVWVQRHGVVSEPSSAARERARLRAAREAQGREGEAREAPGPLAREGRAHGEGPQQQPRPYVSSSAPQGAPPAR